MIAHATPPVTTNLIIDSYATFRSRFQTWSADRQRFVIDLSRDRCEQEADSNLRDILASITTDLESISHNAPKGGAR